MRLAHMSLAAAADLDEAARDLGRTRAPARKAEAALWTAANFRGGCARERGGRGAGEGESEWALGFATAAQLLYATALTVRHSISIRRSLLLARKEVRWQAMGL